MHTGNLHSAAGRIQEAQENLQAAWQETREHWNDRNADAFEETVLRRIAEEVGLAFPAISQMSQTLGAAGRDCDE